MGRSEIRELIRRAQAAEIAGELDQAVQLLGEAAKLHQERSEPGRASVLLRHALRLKPGRSDLEAQLALAEATSAEPPAALEVAARGPTPADPALDCWCSFCCRPKVEAGPMAAGPAGAFICGRCIGASADLVGAGIAAVRAPPPAAPAPSGEAFIEAAVVLSKELGWSLADIRTLSPEEIARALEKLERLRG